MQFALLVMHEGQGLHHLLHDNPDFSFSKIAEIAADFESVPQLSTSSVVLNLYYVLRFVKVFVHLDYVWMVQTRHILNFLQNLSDAHVRLCFVDFFAYPLLSRRPVCHLVGLTEGAPPQHLADLIDFVEGRVVLSHEGCSLARQRFAEPPVKTCQQLRPAQFLEFRPVHGLGYGYQGHRRCLRPVEPDVQRSQQADGQELLHQLCAPRLSEISIEMENSVHMFAQLFFHVRIQHHGQPLNHTPCIPGTASLDLFPSAPPVIMTTSALSESTSLAASVVTPHRPRQAWLHLTSTTKFA
mmetsp:Transcript_7977/g.21984  ORF Transcript_7977/g.21984 Transcript_7977/m.21984 type:complete len:297 (-) Transcript_7977:356-1246(-)